MQAKTSVFRGLALVGALALGVTACEPKTEVILPTPDPVIEVSPSSLTLQVGESRQLAANVRNAAGQPTTVTCSVVSTPGNAVTVTPGCLVTGVSPGTAVVTVTSATNPVVTTTVGVTVLPAGGGNVVVTLTPQNATTTVGDSVRFVATVAGASDQTVRYSSTAPSIAVVDSLTGVAVGVSQGTAVITARSLASPNATPATATLVVQSLGGGSAINIGNITIANTLTPINPANTFGQIDLSLNVTPGSADSLRVLVIPAQGDPVVVEGCSRSFGGTSTQQQTITCSLNTAQFDSAGIVAFRNGNYRIEARLLDNDQVVVSATSNQITFNNVDRLNLQVTAADQAISPATGLLWNDGAVTVTGIPVIFSATGSVSQITVQAINAAAGASGTPGDPADVVVATRTDSDATGGFSVTFPASGTSGLGSVSTDSLVFRAVTVTAGGQPGPVGVDTMIRYDNVAPTGATIALPASVGPNNRFVGGNFTFTMGTSTATATVTGATDPQPGVGGVSTVFYAVPVGTTGTDAEIAAANTPITSASELEATTTDQELILIAQVQDALGNAVFLRLAEPFGVDLAAPTVTIGSMPEQINPTTPFQVIGSDDLSGPSFVRTFLFRITNSGEVCVDLNTNVTGCNPFETAPGSGGTFATPLPTAAGYYIIRTVVVDQAGNVSEVVASRMFIVDTEAPAGSVSAKTITTSGISLTGTMTDNLDLLQYDTRLVFGGLALPFVMPTQISPFGIPLVTSFAATGTSPTVRHLYGPEGGPLSALAFGTWDAAMNFASSPQTPATPVVPSDGLPEVLNPANFVIANAAANRQICGTGTAAACGTGTAAVPSLLTLRATVSGPTGSFANPFIAVYFYRMDMFGVPQVIGVATTASATDVGSGATGRTWTYTILWNGAGLPAQAGAEIFAVGVMADSDAVITSRVAFDIL